jgi:hypothetical protein
MTKEQLEAHLKCSKPFDIAEGYECHLSRCSFCAVKLDTGTEHICVNLVVCALQRSVRPQRARVTRMHTSALPLF